NLETQDAVDAWLRGIRRALHDAQAASDAPLQNITFVEFSPGNFVRMHHSLQKAVVAFGKDSEIPLKISYRRPTDAALREAERAAERDAARRASDKERRSFTAL